MSPSTKKRKTSLKDKKKEEHSPESLPYDLLISIFARVSRLYYPTLSLVSKSFGSLIASPELYQTRSSLGNSESCLYVCLTFHPDPTPRWYTLCKKPNPNITNNISTKKKKKNFVLVAIKFPHTPARPSSVVSIGSNIYNFCGLVDKKPSSSVSILDCRSQSWFEATSMQAERIIPAAIVLDGKIYVVGGCKNYNGSNWMEIFDPETQTWSSVSCPYEKIDDCRYIGQIAAMDGKVYLVGNSSALVYKPNEGTLERVEWMINGWAWESYCVIENVLYSFHQREFTWYDTRKKIWRGVKGLKKGFPRCYDAKLADYGGKMVVLWHTNVRSSRCENKKIWCAVIALERDNNDKEIWGKVEWYDAVLIVPESCRIEHVVSATV